MKNKKYLIEVIEEGRLSAQESSQIKGGVVGGGDTGGGSPGWGSTCPTSKDPFCREIYYSKPCVLYTVCSVTDLDGLLCYQNCPDGMEGVNRSCTDSYTSKG